MDGWIDIRETEICAIRRDGVYRYVIFTAEKIRQFNKKPIGYQWISVTNNLVGDVRSTECFDDEKAADEAFEDRWQRLQARQSPEEVWIATPSAPLSPPQTRHLRRRRTVPRSAEP